MATIASAASQAQAQAAAKQLGYTGAFGGGQAAQWLQQNGLVDQYNSMINGGANTGVVPITAEPFNDYQRSALSSLGSPVGGQQGFYQQSNDLFKQAGNAYGAINANPQQAAGNYTNPIATQALGNMGNLIQQGTQGLNQGAIDQYMNPYQDQVINASISRLNDAGERARAKLLAGQGQRGARSFGDTGYGVALGDLAKDMVSQERDLTSNLLYNGFNNAVNQFNTQQNRTLQGAQQYGQQAGTAQDIFSNAIGNAGTTANNLGSMAGTLRNVTLNNLQNQLYAGDRVQEYNQGIANQVGGNISGAQNYLGNQLSGLAEYLKAFTPTQYGTVQQPNTASKIAGTLGTVGQALGFLGI